MCLGFEYQNRKYLSTDGQGGTTYTIMYILLLESKNTYNPRFWLL